MPLNNPNDPTSEIPVDLTAEYLRTMRRYWLHGSEVRHYAPVGGGAVAYAYCGLAFHDTVLVVVARSTYEGEARRKPEVARTPLYWHTRAVGLARARGVEPDQLRAAADGVTALKVELHPGDTIDDFARALRSRLTPGLENLETLRCCGCQEQRGDVVMHLVRIPNGDEADMPMCPECYTAGVTDWAERGVVVTP